MGQIITKVESVELPRPGRVCMLVLVSYFLVTAGIAYDIINEPPAIGGMQDPVTGKFRPVSFSSGVTSQYIMEGLAGAFMYSLGGLGIIALDATHNTKIDYSLRCILQYLGCACLAVGYLGANLFLRMKMPGYLYSRY